MTFLFEQNNVKITLCQNIQNANFNNKKIIKDELNILFNKFFCGPVWNDWDHFDSEDFILKNAKDLLSEISKLKKVPIDEYQKSD